MPVTHIHVTGYANIPADFQVINWQKEVFSHQMNGTEQKYEFKCVNISEMTANEYLLIIR